MIRFLGALLIIFSCIALSCHQVFRRRTSLQALEELSELFTTINQNISFSLEPLPDLITRLSRENGRQGQRFLQQWNQCLKNDSSASVSWAYEQALEIFDQEKSLPAAAKDILIPMGKTLGTMDLETESERLNSAVCRLEEILKKECAVLEKSEKNVKSLGVLGGIFIVVLLI